MAGISLDGVDTAGGTLAAGGQSIFSVDGKLAIVVGDKVSGHGLPPHTSPVMTAGVDWFTIDGIPVVVEGCTASCGHVSTGQSFFNIG